MFNTKSSTLADFRKDGEAAEWHHMSERRRLQAR